MTVTIKNVRGLLLLAAMCLIAPLTPEIADAKKPDCNVDPSHPSCGGDDGGGDPPSGGNADPQFVYRDGGIFLANADGTSQTEIRSGGIGPKLDAPGMRVLFYNRPSLGSYDYLGLIPYVVIDGSISVGEKEELINAVDIDGTDENGFEFDGRFSSEGVSDWSPDGSKYSYSYYWFGPDGQDVYRMMIGPDPSLIPDPDVFPDGNHMLAYQSEPHGGLNSATWDQSGNFIYHSDSPVNVPFINGLFVIDVRTPPGETIAVLDLGPIMVDSGYAEESNVQSISASFMTGDYSFDPINGVPASNNSLCLMVSTIDWSASNKHPPRFVHIIDLPGIFDPGSNLHCPIATGTSPILDFLGTDFTTDDAGIIGRDSGSNGRHGGISIYDLETLSRTKINKEGGFPDWSN